MVSKYGKRDFAVDYSIFSFDYSGAGEGIRTLDVLLGKGQTTVKVLNRLSVTELAKVTNLSKSYISNVKSGKLPPSKKVIDAIAEYISNNVKHPDYFALFIQSREAIGVSPNTIETYRIILRRFLEQVNYLKATRQQIQKFLNEIPPNKYGLANRHTYFRTIRTFYRWLEFEYHIANPMVGIPAPILGKPILPALDKEQVLHLIDRASDIRNKAIIALFTESGLRLSELTNIKASDIDWNNRTIKVLGKGRKEAYAPFGELSSTYLSAWLGENQPNGSNIWGMNKTGIATMLRRLQQDTGIVCNPHTFRRTFACLLRKADIDTMTIKDLGRWESLEMVQRYTRSITFNDCLKFYRAPLS